MKKWWNCGWQYQYCCSISWKIRGHGGEFGFGLVRFYGILNIVDYLMPNLLFIYTLTIYDLWTHFVDNIFKQAWAHFLYTVKWFQVFLSNMSISIYY